MVGGKLPDKAEGPHPHGLEIRVSSDESVRSAFHSNSGVRSGQISSLPAGDLERGSEDLSAHEFGHCKLDGGVRSERYAVGSGKMEEKKKMFRRCRCLW